LAGDLRLAERLEDAAHRLAARAHGTAPAGVAVTQRAERAARLDQPAARRLQTAKRDHVATALTEVLRGPDEQRPLGLRRGRVELRPDQLPLAGAGVDEHRRLALVE